MSRYRNFISELYSRERSGMRPGIDGVRELLSYLGNPEKRFRAIHVAGTNGKGSTAAILESILRRSELKTGLFTSPHLLDFRERIRINGRMIEEDRVEEFLTSCETQMENGKNSFFEIATALAFHAFAEDRVDIAIVETGLGGRLDSTNVIEPLISIITTIGLEHTDILGETLREIADEKAGIIKNNGTIVTSLGKGSAFRRLHLAAAEKDAKFFSVKQSFPTRIASSTRDGVEFRGKLNGHTKSYFLSLPGRHQVRNASCAILSAMLLREHGIVVSEDSLAKGLSNVKWPGRLDIRRAGKEVVFDVAHNPQAGRSLKSSMIELFSNRKIQAVVGMLKDKDHVSFGRVLLPLIDELWLVEPESDRALPVEELARRFKGFDGTLHLERSIPSALEEALGAGDGKEVLLVTGSFYVVGRAMEKLGLKIPDML